MTKAAILVLCMPCRFPAGNASEDTANCHPYSGGVAPAQHIAGHHFTSREHIGGWLSTIHHDTRLFVHARSEISEGNTGANRVGVKWRCLNSARPMAFGRHETFRPAAVENGGIKFSGANR
jgi:hypothetical protein